MILVDSSVWIDYFNGKDTTETKKLDLYLGVQPNIHATLALRDRT